MKKEQCESCDLTDDDGPHMVLEMTHRILGELVEAKVSFNRLKMINPHAVDCEWEDTQDGQTRGVYIHFFPRFEKRNGRINEPYLLVRIRDANDMCSQEAKLQTRKPEVIENALMGLRTHYLPLSYDENARQQSFTPSMQP
ncbi:hypothetical protein GYB59_01315 [bacterium]|nr:hypothetical protein [bacterium]